MILERDRCFLIVCVLVRCASGSLPKSLFLAQSKLRLKVIGRLTASGEAPGDEAREFRKNFDSFWSFNSDPITSLLRREMACETSVRCKVRRPPLQSLPFCGLPLSQLQKDSAGAIRSMKTHQPWAAAIQLKAAYKTTGFGVSQGLGLWLPHWCAPCQQLVGWCDHRPRCLRGFASGLPRWSFLANNDLRLLIARLQRLQNFKQLHLPEFVFVSLSLVKICGLRLESKAFQGLTDSHWALSRYCLRLSYGCAQSQAAFFDVFFSWFRGL